MRFVHIFVPRANGIGYVYLLNFLLCLHIYLVTYINSSFLETYVSKQSVNLAFMAGAAFGIVLFVAVPSLLRRFGNTTTLIVLTLLEIVTFAILAIPTSLSFVLIAFVSAQVLSPVALYCLDVYLEALQDDEEETGASRGVFLTASNIALALSPAITGFVLGTSLIPAYGRVYGLAALVLVPFLLIVIMRLRTFNNPVYDAFSIRRTLGVLAHSSSIRSVIIVHFLMRVFFSWMVIYMPLYLHQVAGFSWEMIGIILTIILLPYLFIEWPAGRIADARFGEKELLAIGCVLTAVATAFLSFLGGAPIILWISILLLTRVGAALIESMTETYFFKHVRGNNADTISFFRMLQPLSYLAGPMLGGITLALFPFSWMWIVLGVVVLIGLPFSLTITDTK